MILLKRILKTILKYRTSSALTLFSLVVSFVGIIILTLYVSFEKSFDRFHENAETVYRLETQTDGSWLPAKLSPIIKQNIPEVESVCRLWISDLTLSTPDLLAENKKFESNVIFADTTFFNMFSFPLVLGDKASVLKDPYAVVLSETMANKLFGNANPIGQQIIGDKINYTVTGVMKDIPKNSSFEGECVFSFLIYTAGKNYSWFDQWSEWSFTNMLQLRPGANPQEIAQKIDLLPDVTKQLEQEKESYKGAGCFLNLRPLGKLHFLNDGSLKRYSNPLVLNVLSMLIVILAVMGAVNFINFSTSQAPLRAKALSVARVLGGRRISSMVQLISEAVILAIVAMLISLAIYLLSYRQIESVFAIQGLQMNGRYMFFLGFIAFAVLFGVLAGAYPARYITGPSIAQAIKGNVVFGGKGKTFRNSLVIVQFVCTIGLIASSFIIEKQLSYWRNFDIGINKNNVVYLSTSEELRKHHKAFANELLKNRDIEDYTYSQFIPGQVGMGWGREVDGQYIQFKCWPVDERFIDFFGIEIDKGRKFAANADADLNNFILNEKAVAKFGWDDPTKRNIGGMGANGQVVGVAKDFNFNSLKSEVSPMAFWLADGRKNQLILRVTPGNYTQTRQFIAETANKFDPKNQIEVKFLDDTLNKLYEKEERIAHFIEFVALWCMLLAVTGLLGLIIFICRDRIKEIGIRKVNGATITEVVSMLNRNFVKWVAVAFVIATPVSWYAMHRWLENFAYKTELSWWVFALSGIIALGIALLTVSYQSYKAATRNPVEALRYE